MRSESARGWGKLTTWPASQNTIFLLRLGMYNLNIPESQGAQGMSLERAILLVVCLVMVVSLLMGVYHSPSWLWITGMMGLHLVQASFTGMCPVVRLFQKLGLPQRAGFS